jgi:hypothetical protein
VLIATRLFGHTFAVSPGDRIAGCLISEFEIPRSLDDNGDQRFDRYAFTLRPGEQPSCRPGETVYLVQS